MAECCKIGDYVLATKYSDGDPQDQWGVGFYESDTDHTPPRYNVVAADGSHLRGNGFRRIQRITADQGAFLLGHAAIIKSSRRSVWWWLSRYVDDDGADVGRIVPVADDTYQQPPEDTRQSLTQDVALFANIEPEVPFRLHQSYEQPGDTKQVACAVCGRKTLEIGQGDRFTVARCPDCGHEECIHEG